MTTMVADEALRELEQLQAYLYDVVDGDNSDDKEDDIKSDLIRLTHIIMGIEEDGMER